LLPPRLGRRLGGEQLQPVADLFGHSCHTRATSSSASSMPRPA
jgi:hypothetical protein